MSKVPRTEFVPGHAGTRIAVHRLGEGEPVLLIHGLASSAQVNWIRYGHAARLAEAGFEAIMIDLRGHGESDAPQDPAAYPQEVALLDGLSVLAQLRFSEFHLVGYSLGARIAAQLVGEGARPDKLVLAGMGLDGLVRWTDRRQVYLDMLDRFDVAQPGDKDYLAIQFIKTVGVDPIAMRHLLLCLGNIGPEVLERIDVPTLVLVGEQDDVASGARDLANRMARASLETIPGNHMNCVTKPQLGEAIAHFLAS